MDRTFLVYSSLMSQSKTLLLSCLALVSVGFFGCSPTDTRYYLYVGTYTDGESDGLYVAEFNPNQRTLSKIRLAAELEQCTYQAIDNKNSVLYSTGVMEGLGENNGVLKSFKIEPDGSLTEVSVRATEKSPVLAHVNYSERFGHVFTVSYHGGQVYSYPVDKTGVIGMEAGFAQHTGGSNVVENRQDTAHPHSVFVHTVSPFIYVPDLGLDAVVVYEFDEVTGAITEVSRHQTAPGAGPRHMAFMTSDPYEKPFAYINNEIDSTVIMARTGIQRGNLEYRETNPTLPPSFSGSSTTAQIVLSPDERHLYVSNRGHDSITVFGVYSNSLKIYPKGFFPSGGKTPRNFSIDPSGKWMAVINQDSNTLVIFEVDPETGLLAETDLKVSVPKPACVTFVRAREG